MMGTDGGNNVCHEDKQQPHINTFTGGLLPLSGPANVTQSSDIHSHLAPHGPPAFFLQMNKIQRKCVYHILQFA